MSKSSDNLKLPWTNVLGAQFDSVEDADAWYMNYSRLVGFSVRKNELRRSKSGQTTIRRWVCNLEGYRAEKYLANDNRVREPRPITRTGCKASFRVNYDNSSGKFTVTEFKTEHNHPLTSPNEVHLLRSHRHVSEGDLAQAKALRHVGVKTCQVVDYMGDQVGGSHNLRFKRKDLQNRLDADRSAEIGDTDSVATIAYFTAKSDNDPGLYHEYTLDDENRLRNLFWTDYMARYDYECFGDVLAFDATYKTNAYQKPLVTLVGTNHHRRTTVFGFGLLGDETVESYTWLLQTFLSAMGNRKPKSVITDGDKAMAKAIKTVFFGATHRLCCWHLERNAQANIKNEDFTRKFRDLMLTGMSAGEFDQRWFALVNEFKLHEHGWVKQMYAKRHKWAEAFLKGTFFAGMRSTQWCESIHCYLNRFLQYRLKLYEFVLQIDRALRNIRTTEVQDEFKTKFSTPVLTTHLRSLEKHATNVFPISVFHWIREEIRQEATLIQFEALNCTDTNYYTLTQFGNVDIKWTVVYNKPTNKIDCSCQMMDSAGIPCRHMFHVMKVEQFRNIPDNMILHRWTKKVKDYTSCNLARSQVDSEISDVARFSSLSTATNKMCFYAAKNEHSYKEALAAINQLTSKFQELFGGQRTCHQSSVYGPQTKSTVLDPVVVRTKGGATRLKKSPSNNRKCSVCTQPGHTARRCPIASNSARSSEANAANNDSWGTSILARSSEHFSFYNSEASYEIETQNECGSSSQPCSESTDHLWNNSSMPPSMGSNTFTFLPYPTMHSDMWPGDNSFH
ncbi:protein FAR1-RELATED SEQUENCE [Citrus sinensis]|uniref:Protein FAR1-RELATED SEQUENCE n=1 Tax=Citrus sinensis TaxID=2711 RepID=A0ACB8NTX5_CITSI|nr:protein FAR1-RELATED SEQUENCE [Citrus sinensis]